MSFDKDHEDFEQVSFDEESGGISFLDEYRASVVFGLLGLISLGLGLFFYKDSIFHSSGEIEIIEASDEAQQSEKMLVVEIAGAVKNPGVYELEAGSRVDDLIEISGGLQDNADPSFLDKIINRAAKLSDGQKIYIPTVDEQSNASSDNISTGGSAGFSGEEQKITGVQDTRTKHVNVNTASQKELEELWGIGPVTAKNIIDQRPYSTVEELLTKKILKSNVFERNKELLTVY